MFSDAQIETANAHLISTDAAWGPLIERAPVPQFTPFPTTEPWQALVRVVAFQQLHGTAATAIFNRFLDMYRPASFPSVREVLATPEEDLRGCGFSRRKAGTIRGIAIAQRDGLLPSAQEAVSRTNDELIKAMTHIHGIGPWSVQMYLIKGLGRADVMPAGDYGVRDGYRHFVGLDELPTESQMRRAAESWAPWRSIASWYLWRSPRPNKATE